MNLVLPSSLAGQGLLWSSWEVHCSLALVLGVRAKLDTVHLAPTLSPTLPRSMCELGCPCPNLAAYRCLLMKGPGAESSACGQGAKQKPSVTLAQHTVYSFLGGWVGGWLSALPLALKLSTVVPTGGGDRLGVMRASPSRRQFSGPSPRGRPSELPRAVRKLSQRSLSGDGSLLRGTETRRGRSGPALWV